MPTLIELRHETSLIKNKRSVYVKKVSTSAKSHKDNSNYNWKEKPLSISKQLKYFGTHTNNLESKFKTKKGFLDLMKYAVKHMPLKSGVFQSLTRPLPQN